MNAFLLTITLLFTITSTAIAQTAEMAPNGGFEDGLKGWVAWGQQGDMIGVDGRTAHSGTASARIVGGRNALYFHRPMAPGKAYEVRFFRKATGVAPKGKLGLSFYTASGGHRSAGFREIEFPASTDWTEFREVFMPTSSTASCQVAFYVGAGTTLWVDDVSLKEVPRPAGLREPLSPWDGLKHRTAKPLFAELLTKTPGGYSVVSWSHMMNRENAVAVLGDETPTAESWPAVVDGIYKEMAESGVGLMDLPGRAGDESGLARHRELFSKYKVKYDVWSEGSASISAGLRRGAELLNPEEADSGAKAAVSWVDPLYVEAQKKIVTKLGEELRGKPFVGVYYGKDEPSIRIPRGAPEGWGAYGQAMRKEVREKYGFEPPLPNDPAFAKDPQRWLRWLAYNRWMADRFVATRSEIRAALRKADPKAVYSPCDYWFMSGFQPYDFPAMAKCSDLFELDPYASSAERKLGRGIYNHGFGAKFMSDLTGKPVRIIAQAFDYAGYSMTPQDLREWLSQAMRCGASAISYYEMDNPRFSDPARWKMMLHLGKTITRMNRVALPADPDTAVLYASYTHASMGSSTGGDQIYTAHALVGEQAGSWYRFVADSQLERGEKSLAGYKAVYLPIGRYMTPEATARIEAYVRAGGTLICGDADAFGSDLAGRDTSAVRERLLGVRALGPKRAQSLQATALPGVKAGTSLPLFAFDLWGEVSLGRAREIAVLDAKAKILARYPDGKPAVVSRKLGKGRVITFAANPFAPELLVQKTPWPAVFRGLQTELGCKVDRKIWRFALPDTGEGRVLSPGS